MDVSINYSILVYFVTCVSQMITMTTVWLLLLVVVSSSRIVDSQSTTDNETCSEEPICRPMLEKLLYDQHQLRQRVPQLVHQHRFGMYPLNSVCIRFLLPTLFLSRAINTQINKTNKHFKSVLNSQNHC